jgi:hypothetical protein
MDFDGYAKRLSAKFWRKNKMQQVFAKEIRFVRGKVVIPSIPISTDDNHLPSRQFVPIQEQMSGLGYTIKPALDSNSLISSQDGQQNEDASESSDYPKEIRFVRGKIADHLYPIPTDNHLPSKPFVPIQEQMNGLGYTIKPALDSNSLISSQDGQQNEDASESSDYPKEIRFVRGKIADHLYPIPTDNHLPSKPFVPIQEQMNGLGYTIKPALDSNSLISNQDGQQNEDNP